MIYTYECLRCHQIITEEWPEIYEPGRFLCRLCIEFGFWVRNNGDRMNCEPCAKTGKGPVVALRIVPVIEKGNERKVPMCARCYELSGVSVGVRSSSVDYVVEKPYDSPAVEAVKKGDLQVFDKNAKLCQCGRPLGHTGRHIGYHPPNKVEVSQTESTSTTHKRTQKITVQQPGPSQEVIELREAVSTLTQRLAKIDGQPDTKAFDFWLAEPVKLSTGEDFAHEFMNDGTARLWGALVPEALLDAVWYSLSAKSKARLLSAIAVARYKEGPPEAEP